LGYYKQFVNISLLTFLSSHILILRENEAHKMLVLINAKSIRLPRVLPALIAAPSHIGQLGTRDVV
jgi:hypothetical protein